MYVDMRAADAAVAAPGMYDHSLNVVVMNVLIVFLRVIFYIGI